MRITVAVYYFLPVFVILVILFNFTFSKFLKKYCKIEVKTLYAYSDTLGFQLITLTQIYISIWDSKTTPIDLFIW